ncbi:potassium channel family protein [Synechococcus sp. MIT S9452]|uniref:potassium channel family protein n=1 Tax=Synechococcus sp. MIT S9452 TaxID=3082546 RepID=UPI0039A5C16E
MNWLRRLVNRYPNQLLLLLTLGVLVCFAFPQIGRLSYVLYSFIALLLTCGPAGRGHSRAIDDRLYRALGALAVAAMWLWLITPMNLLASGVPLALSWSVLVGWSLVRMIQSLAARAQVSRPLLMGAIAGYLHLGLTAGLVMGAVETIQPGSFQPLELTKAALASGDLSVIESSGAFAEINYFAFVCLTTVGFGDINPALPLARMLSVVTSIAGPLYLAVVMGVLIGRFAGSFQSSGSSD